MLDIIISALCLETNFHNQIVHTWHAKLFFLKKGEKPEYPTTLMFPERQRGEACRTWLLQVALVIMLSYLGCPLIDPVGAITIQTAHLQQVTVAV
jgi:hypothetical protein